MKIKLVALIMLLFSFLCAGEKVSASVIATTESSSYEVDEVVSKEELKDGYTINKPVNVLGEEYYFSVNDFYYDGYRYLAIGYTSSEEGMYYNGYPYIAYYENEKLLWSKVYKSLGLGEFKSFVFEDECIVVIGEYEMNDNVYPFIISFDYEGNIVNQKIFLNLQNSFLTKIYNSYGNYIIVGVSFSNEYEFKDRDNNNNIFFTYLIDKNFQKIDSLYFGNDKNNTIYEVIKNGEDIIIYGRTSGEGQFNILGKESGRVCITITERCEYGNYVLIPDTINGLITLTNYQDKVYLVNKKYENNEINFYEINDDQVIYGFTLVDDYQIETTQRIKIDTYEDIIVVFEKVNNNGNCYLYLSTFKNDQLYYKNIIKESFSYDLKGVIFDGLDVIYYGAYVSNNTSRFTVYALLNIKLNEGYCSFNGINVLGKEEEISYEIFGNHTGYIIYTYENKKIIVDKIVNVPLKTNVKEGEIYDLGSFLWFNGEGYLNNQEVGNGIEILDEGMYILEIRGENDRIVYKIYAKNLTTSLEKETEDYREYIKYYEKTIDKQDVCKMSYQITDFKNNGENSHSSIYIFLSIIVICITAGTLIPVKKKKEVIVNA